MSKDNLILKIKELKLERSEFYKLDWRQHPNLEELISSCKISLRYVDKAIASAPGYGKGFGPLNHLISFNIKNNINV